MLATLIKDLHGIDKKNWKQVNPFVMAFQTSLMIK